MFNAKIDLNPHQVESALFAFNSPLSNGVIIADEVGLGKTIEAGMIMCQYWAENKKNIMIIAPASLRKQWSVELQEKFFIESIILESKSFTEELKRGNTNPFNQKNKIVITSYNFASNKNEYLTMANLDLVVIDEAHKLRNVYKNTNKSAKKIKNSLSNTKKVLLTATPLQNSLLELFGLVSIIDDKIFGNVQSFKMNYINQNDSMHNDLINRLKNIMHRTLRKDVLEYIKYTNRIPIVEEFYPSDEEQLLYDKISDFLLADKLYAIPSKQRTLIILVMRKLLASSTTAIEGTLNTMSKRLQILLDKNEFANISEIIDDESELIEEYLDEDEDLSEGLLTKVEISEIKNEIDELIKFKNIASNIKLDAKTFSLNIALKNSFKMQEKLGGNKKALIFTESRRTQIYLKEFLEENGYFGKVVLYNGTNTDERSREIYTEWMNRYKGSDKITGSISADKKQAIVDFFKEEAEIMIATEAGSEGINLQFCNLIINYDLPWNPQRVEQRIGRCHRYGQKYDVVVVNFINKRNAVDQRVYELLSDKFKLFEGIFGASDDVLGSIESGIDFEKRILEIYQTCRTPEEIDLAFNKIQKELEVQIEETMSITRKKLLEHFDSDVHLRLKTQLDESKKEMNRIESTFWDITKHELKNNATFDEKNFIFKIEKSIFPNIKEGFYQLISQKNENKNAHIYRINSDLGQKIIEQSKNRILEDQELIFDLTNHKTNISSLKILKEKSGYLVLSKLQIKSFDKEEYLVFSSITTSGMKIDSEIIIKIFELDVVDIKEYFQIEVQVMEKLSLYKNEEIDNLLKISEQKNGDFFNLEIEKLNNWVEDQILSYEKELENIKKEINQKQAFSRTQPLEEKLKIQVEIRNLETKRNKLRKQIEENEDMLYEKRNGIIDNLANNLNQGIIEEELFKIKWSIV